MADSNEPHSNVASKTDCGRHFGQKIPTFMTTPTVIRVYNNISNCSEICHCLSNRSIVCKTLPCSPNLSCRHKDSLFVHGSSFPFNERGHCRCIFGEMVCTKSPFNPALKAGLFLHLGYSLSDRYLVEANSIVKFQPESVTTKLATLLNEDSAEQFCRLSLYSIYDGNLLFVIGVSKHSPKHTNYMDSCIHPAKMLANMINSRNSAVVTDAELSIIKVAQLERVQIHDPPNSSESRQAIPARSSSSASIIQTLMNSTLVVLGCWIMSFHLLLRNSQFDCHSSNQLLFNKPPLDCMLYK